MKSAPRQPQHSATIVASSTEVIEVLEALPVSTPAAPTGADPPGEPKLEILFLRFVC